MIRQIVKIDEDKCSGCGLCAKACQEAAISIIDGKARLIQDNYCDGLGNCLPVCPEGAITFEKREAAGYDENAVKANLSSGKPAGGCPGAAPRSITAAGDIPEDAAVGVQNNLLASKLKQWPVQIRLVPVNARYFDNANLLISADCSAYAYGGFHQQFMKNRITMIGCPKLDDVDYTGKLKEILAVNNIKSVTVVKIEVPCCSGIEYAAISALKASGKKLPLQVFTLTTEGKVLSE